MNALRPISYYDERAETVDLTEITSSRNNAEILRRLRDNDPELAWLSIIHHDGERDVVAMLPAYERVLL